MSKSTLISFLESIDADLSKPGASEAFRRQTANKLTHTVIITKAKIDKTIRVTLEAASNVSGNGELLLKQVKTEYDQILNNLIKEIRQNFNDLKIKAGDTIKFTRGSRSGNNIRVVIFETPGDRGSRDNFSAAESAYKQPLQTFYENFLQIIGQELTRVSTSNKSGKVDLKKAGQVFNLEHFKNSSNVRAFLADTVHKNLTEHYTKEEYAALQADLKKLGLSTKLKVEKNAKTGEVKVFLGSQILNVAQSSSEQALKRDLQKSLKKAIERLKSDKLIKLQGSASIYEVKTQKLVKSVTDPFKKVPGAKVTSSTKNKKLGNLISTAELDVSPKLKQAKKVKPSLKRKRMRGARTKSATGFDALQIIGLLNKQLPETVRKNMQEPALVNRSGRFASSVKVTEVIKTPKGFPSIGYTYQRNPYEVFEEGSSGNWSNGNRDPRDLIDKSIREIAAQFAIGRFYTRRV